MTFDEQLHKLDAHGMVISDREKAKDILKKVNYYRFTGYALQFRKDPSGSDYIEGTTFETVYHLYKVDEILRDTFHRYIEKAEVYYRTQIAYGFSTAKCTDAPYDQHYDENNFYNKKGYIYTVCQYYEINVPMLQGCIIRILILQQSLQHPF